MKMLEQIEGLNLEIGTPIEVTVNTKNPIGCTSMGYFQGIVGRSLYYNTEIGNYGRKRECGEVVSFIFIKKVRVLESKKEIINNSFK